MTQFARICLFLMLLAAAASAQLLPDSTFRQPPANGLSDPNGILGRDPEALRRMIWMINGLRSQHGFRVIVVVEPSLFSTSPSDTASQLQQAWIPGGEGLVVVFEADTGEIGFGRRLEPGDGMTPGKVGVPAFSLVEIVSASLQSVGSTAKPDIYLETLVTDLCSRLTQYFVRKAKPSNPGRSKWLTIATAGALSLLALCGIGVGWLMGKADRKQSETLIFPEVSVPERLGAAYGGGSGSTRNFGIEEKK